MRDKEAKPKTYAEVLRKLRDLASQVSSFNEFIEKIQTWPNWYLGKPMPPEMNYWTKKEFQQFYEENRG